MPLLLAVTLVAATTVQPTCSWDNPGHNPYTGSTAAAIDRYTDIPEAVRSTLKRRLAEGQSDDKVDITRDGINGKYQYGAAIRDMHFGRASVCGTVTRSKWSASRSEPGAVYCVDQHCILVPRICGNVSRITRNAPAVAAKPKEDERELAAPVEFADLGLADAPPRDDMPLDDPEEMARRAAQKRALGALGDILTEEELAEAADDSRYGLYTHNAGFVFADGDGGGGPHITAVPEADTWAMLLAGLGLVGWQVRRQTKAAK
ncbi:PEP-CTERM sorting domain-containing protein [Duganella sp. FT135W]|uniref:PEP-CTERM sorting domain-containing protein n=1 Tax=Duganella flavida TaxID=2692175 RepID=A0A6L8K6I8_9BURK|nr:MHFG family PEP-CTERM protein [Duganella flavida]MYM22555.1 PEP-CTERM sorting domain-containing protein [Duganella flavida]